MAATGRICRPAVCRASLGHPKPPNIVMPTRILLAESDDVLRASLAEQLEHEGYDVIAALNAAFAYCEKAYDTMTDASAVQIIKLFGNDAPRLSALTVNNMHDLEHYGNLATYMRMKNIVPPSSEQPAAPPQAPKK